MRNFTLSIQLKRILFFLSILLISSWGTLQAQKSSKNISTISTSTQTDFNAGAAVIDMGITPQNVNNGLKPYGLVYDLVTNHGIPVYWIIKNNKSFVDASNKVDQTDITVKGTTTRLGSISTGTKHLKSGPFLIPAEFIEDAYAVIETWQTANSGLTVYWNLDAITNAPVRGVITSFPNIVIYPVGGIITSTTDTDIEVGFYNRAGIPESSGSFRKGNPEDITTCDQFYVLSHHTDPNTNWDQDDVNYLFDFVERGGNIWMGCHDVSISESLTTSGGKAYPKLNFLSTTGLMPYKNLPSTPIYDAPPLPIHNKNFINANVDYELTSASDPIMQFMKEIHPALNGNSEHVYLPLAGGWRGSTTIGFYDPSHPDVLGNFPNSPGKAAIIAYGRAYGESSYGQVLYQGSHISKDNSNPLDPATYIGENRLFGNFLLQSALETAPVITIPTLPTNLTVCSGQDLTLTPEFDNVPTGTQTYLWESSIISGSGAPVSFIPDSSSLTTTIDFPHVLDPTVYKITFTLTVTPGGCSNPITAKFITSITVDPPECTVHIDNCPSGVVECYDGAGGTPATWIPPHSWFQCCNGDISDESSFIVEFDIPESSNPCWLYSRVQRIGSNNMRLFQSGGGSEVSFTGPLQYFDNSSNTPVTMELIVPSGTFDWILQVLDGTSVINTQTIPNISSTGNYVITIPSSVPNGAYNLKFLFDDHNTGLGANNHIEVDRLYYNAILLDDCAEGINFVTTATHSPGNEFPIGTNTVTYTSILTFPGITPIEEVCTFDVEIVEVTASSSQTNVKCFGEANGAIDLTVTGGSPMYSFAWTTSDGSGVNPTSEDQTGLTVGTYNVTITDANDCTAQESVTITEPPKIDPPTSTGDITECEAIPIQTLNANDAISTSPFNRKNTFSQNKSSNKKNKLIILPTGITWFDAANGGNIINSPTWNTVGSKTYYAQYSNGTCISLTRTAVTLTINAIPTADAGAPKTIDCNNTSATIGTTAVTGHTYAWTPTTGLNDATLAKPTATPTATQTYSLVVTETATGCSSVADTVVVTVDNDLPTADAGAPKTIDCNNTSAVIGTTAVTGHTYAWTPTTGLNDATLAKPTATPTATQTYSLVVTETATGCSSVADTVVVTVDTDKPTADAGAPKTIDCNNTSAVIGTTAVTGHTYAWIPTTGLNDATLAKPTATPTATQTYSLVVTETATGCSSVADTVVVTVDNDLPTADAGAPKTIDCNNTSATIGTTAVTGHTYAWIPTTGLNDATLAKPTATPTATQTYSLVVTETATGCSSVADTVVVTVDNDLPTADAGAPKTIDCNNTSAVIGTTAVTGHTYAWTPTTGLNDATLAKPTATPTATQTYSLVVTETATGCSSVADTVVVTVDNDLPTADAGAPKTIDCNNTSAVIGTTAVTGHTYAWIPTTGLNDATLAKPTATPTATQTYSLVVTETATGCSSVADTVVVTVDNDLPTADAGAPKTIDCNNTSAVIGTTAVTGHTYAWTPTTGLNDATLAKPTATPTATQTYSLVVTETATGCSSVADTVVVTVDTDKPTADAGAPKTIDCNNTSATIGTTAVTGHTYAWTPTTGLNDATLAKPTATPTATQTYSLVVTETATGCLSVADTVVVTVDTDKPTADAGAPKTIDCNNTSATIGTTAVTGHTYAWTPTTGLNDATLAKPTATPTATQTYSLVVTETATGCSSVADTVVVTVDNDLPTADAGAPKTIDCNNTSAVIGTTAVTGHTYAWTPTTGLNDATLAKPTATPTATQTYSLVVTETATGCSSVADTVVVTVDTDKPTADAGAPKTIDCNNTSAVIGTTAVTGHTYAWTPTTGLNDATLAKPTATPTATQTYSLVVTETATGCLSVADTVVVTVDTDKPTADAGAPKTIDCNNTSAVIGTTAVTGHTYAWTPTTGLNDATLAKPTATPTATQTYSLVVTETATGCSSVADTVVVTVDNDLPTADAGAPKTIDCNNTSATIGTTAVTGHTYAWTPTTGLNDATLAKPTATPTATQTYSLVVTETATGCSSVADTVVVTVDTDKPTADAGAPKTIDCNNTSAVIGTTAVTGHTYAWTPTTGLNDATLAKPTATPTATQTYSLVVTETATGCSSVADTVVVTVDNDLPTADAGAPKTIDCNNTSATIGTTAVTGHTYAWTPTTGLNDATLAKPTATPTATQTYSVVVTETATGCSSLADTVVVTVDNDLPTADAGAPKTIDCNNTSATIGTASVSGHTYAWLPITGLNDATLAQPTATPTATQTYSVVVTETATGCSSLADTVVVTVDNDLPTADAGAPKTIDCNNTSAVIGTTAVTGHTYAWTPTTGLNDATLAKPTATPTATQTYSVVVTETATGCSSVADTVVVTVDNDLPTADAGAPKTIDCNNTSAVIGTTAVTGHTYAWTPTTGLNDATLAKPTATPTATQTYSVVVTETATGCSSLADTVVVTVDNDLPTADAGAPKTIDCNNTSAVIGTTAVTGHTYAWTPTTGLNDATLAKPTATPTATQTYSLVVTETATGCSSLADTVVVTVDNDLPTADAGAPKTIDCNNTSAVIGTTAVTGHTYAWTPTTGLNDATLAKPTATPTATQTYSLVVTETATGCSSVADTVVVTVDNDLPTAPISGGNQAECLADPTHTLTATATAPSGAIVIWYDAAIGGNVVQDPSLTGVGTETYWALSSNTATNGCISSTRTAVNLEIFECAISIEKTASPNTQEGCNPIAIGEDITYTFTVTNQGNIDITNVVLNDPLIDSMNPISGPFSGDSVNSGILDVGEVWIYNATYQITQDNIINGQVVNTAEIVGTINATSNPYNVTDEASITVVLCQNAEISITKSSESDTGNCIEFNVNDEIDYIFIVTNEGDVPVTNVEVYDPLIDPFNPIAGPFSGDILNPGILDVGEVWIYNATYTIVQADINNGSTVNIATVNGDSVLGDIEHTSNSVSVLICQSASIALIKVGTYNDEDQDGCTDIGETISYDFTVTNTGNVTLLFILVTDPLTTVNGGPLSSLIPGESDSSTFTASYTITQADIDSGIFENQATARGVSPTGQVIDLSDNDSILEDDPTVTELCQSADIALIKMGVFNDENGDGCSDIDETISYAFTVINTGNVTLTDIMVTDPLVTISGGPITLTSGESNTGTFTATYSITQTDIDSGGVINQATVSGLDHNSITVSDQSDDNSEFENDPTTTQLCQNSSIALIKVGTFNDNDEDGCTDVGETISYAFTVINTGNVTLTDIMVTDPLVSVSGGPITLASGESDPFSFTATYSITQADIDSGGVINQATISGIGPNSITVSDQSDDNSEFENDPTTTQLCQDPSIALIKVGTFIDEDEDGCTNVDETISYAFTIINTGNVTLTDIMVTDPLVTVSGGPIALAPGDSDALSFTATYSINQADIDAGDVINQATATALDPNSDPVTDLSDDNSELENDPTTTQLCQDPLIALIKIGTFIDEDKDGCTDVDETISYAFTVINTGNVTLTDIMVTDPLVKISGGPITLAPGDSDAISFTATYSITQVNINAGEVVNQATATGLDPNSESVTDLSDDTSEFEDDPTVTELCQDPNIALIKIGIFNDEDQDGCSDIGETINYSFKIINTGNVTLTNVLVTDPFVAVIGDPITLTAGEVDISAFSASYTITQSDINNGYFSNQALVEGTSPNETIVSDLSDNASELEDDPTIITLCQDGAIAFIKTGELNDEDEDECGAEVGETITYTFNLTNQGNVSLTNIVLTDALLGGIITGPDSGDTNGDTILDLDEEWIYTANYVITQEDVTAEEVVNQATVIGLDPNEETITDLSDDDSYFEDDPTIINLNCVIVFNVPGVALIKEAVLVDENGNDCPDVGENIFYTFIVANTSENGTLVNVTITDPMVTVQGGPINLAFEEVDIDSFTATYTITQEDFDSGILINQATVFATDPVSEIVVTDLSDNDSFDENDPTVVEFCLEDETFNAISLEKTGEWNDENGDLIAQVGETISYLFSATNTGESTLFNISLQDPLPGINIEGGPIEELLPGESDDTTFTGTYILTQVDIDNGEVVNQATVTGEDEDENEVSDDSDDPNNVDNVDNNGDGEPDDPTVVVLPGVLPGVFEVFNGITPNGDGLNDFLWIQGISAYPDNNLKIFNRWGILIFDTDGYEEDAGGNVFTGEADARLIIEEDKKVPTGTYFYVLTFPEDPDKNPGKTSYSGYLYLNR